VNPSNKKRTHMDDLQDIADYKKTEIVLYNNVFHKIRRFEPSGEIGKKVSRKLNRRPIEIVAEIDKERDDLLEISATILSIASGSLGLRIS
jgi:hypothetical protein